jgi:hypothetical protein
MMRLAADVVDFHAWLMPWPNYFVLAPNIRFFKAHGVKGVFEEGNYKSYGGDLEAMKSYVMTKLLMDPSLNETEVMADFIDGWYGAQGAPVIWAYMHAFYESALATNTYLSIFLGVTPQGSAPGEKPPVNPGKAACAATPKNMCTSGCPAGGPCKPGSTRRGRCCHFGAPHHIFVSGKETKLLIGVARATSTNFFFTRHKDISSVFFHTKYNVEHLTDSSAHG